MTEEEYEGRRDLLFRFMRFHPLRLFFGTQLSHESRKILRLVEECNYFSVECGVINPLSSSSDARRHENLTVSFLVKCIDAQTIK